MTQLLQNAAYGTALILAVALLRGLLKDRLAPEARLALWAVCLFRLLTPAAPESALSLWGLSRLFEPEQVPAAPSAYLPWDHFAPAAGGTPAPAAPDPGPVISWETALIGLWLMAGAALAVRYALSWKRTRRAVSCAIPLDCGDERYAPLPKFARLREGPIEGAPLTFGVVRPTVVLSPGLEGEELDCVLAHEGVHAARRDNLWHYVMAAALVVHWWNPAVWLMSRLLRRDIELSCDRAAVRRLGADRRADYAKALISLATQESGPDFCQTFGRKAAEERILSIMKFKKTSVIGVIFSLALVLAVTAAFASEPKEPDDTIVFHDQAFNRTSLSQETLDWLDWYLTLTEEEQLAISYVPSELREDRDASTQDAYSSEKAGSSTQMANLPAEVLAYAQDLSIGMPREEVHALLGEPSFSSSSLFSDTYELDPDTHKPQLGIYYDVDGTVAQVKYFSDGTDPDVAGIDLTPYLSSSASASKIMAVDPDRVDLSMMKELLAKKVADGEITQAEADRRLAGTEEMLEQARQGELELVTYADGDGGEFFYPASGSEIYFRSANGSLIPVGPDGVSSSYVLDPNPTGYQVELPAPSGDGGIFGQKYYDYGFAASGNIIRTSSGSYALCTAKGCNVSYDHCHIDGKVVRVYQENPGLLCAQPDCTNEEPHQHGGVQYAGKAPEAYVVLDPDMEPAPSGAVPDPTPTGQPAAGGLIHLVPSEATGWKDGYIPSGLLCHPSYPGTVTNPDEAVKYMEWLSTQPDTLTQPLYDADWNIIGEYRSVNRFAPSSSSTSYPVCIVDGCALTGPHEHDGTTYCGGAGHHGNTCDGSCIYCAQQAAANGTYSTSGHHGNGHH